MRFPSSWTTGARVCSSTTRMRRASPETSPRHWDPTRSTSPRRRPPPRSPVGTAGTRWPHVCSAPSPRWRRLPRLDHEELASSLEEAVPVVHAEEIPYRGIRKRELLDLEAVPGRLEDAEV